MRVVRYLTGLLLALALGVALGFTIGRSRSEPARIITNADNTAALNAVLNDYDQWCADKLSLPSIPGAGTPGFVRQYYLREQQRFAELTRAFSLHLVPSAGTGGVNARYLYDLSRAQEDAIGRWLAMDSAGEGGALSGIVNQIKVNDSSMERAILLFRILLGKADLEKEGFHR